jgi:hypothetical protein
MKNILNLTISQLNKYYLRKWSQDLTTTQDLVVFQLKLRLNIIPMNIILIAEPLLNDNLFLSHR